MGDLFDLGDYRDQKEREEIEELQEKLKVHLQKINPLLKMEDTIFPLKICIRKARVRFSH